MVEDKERNCNIYSDIWSQKNKTEPSKVSIFSHKKYLFVCKKCNHDYEQVAKSKTYGAGCPFCANQKICGDNKCLLCVNKSCIIYSDIWSSKNEIEPYKIFKSTAKKYWFHCLTCSHDYEQTPSSKTRGHGCPYCSKQKLCGIKECSFCLSKSCDVYSNIWSMKNKIEPYKVSISNGKKYWFFCDKCHHHYEHIPASKTSGRGCFYCSGRNICGNVDCVYCLKKSCLMYEEIWSSKNELPPVKICKSTDKKYWFNCKKCLHDYKQSPANKTKGAGCPYCSSYTLCKIKECLYCLPKSCNKYSDIWSSKNYLEPYKVSISNGERFLFDCSECGNEYSQRPAEKTSGNGCPFCKNKTERKVSYFLKDNQVKFKSQFKIIKNRSYDFFLEDYKLIIEIDGDQHFRQVSNWESPLENLEKDIQKMNKAIENGYSILRIYQPDIWFDKIEWKECITNNLYIREKPDITCISSDSEIYNKHKFNYQ